MKELEDRTFIPIDREEQLGTFLDCLAKHGNIGDACREAQLDRRNVHKARKDPHFQRAFEEAMELGIQAAEDELLTRATRGTPEPVFYKGRRVATVRKKSDLLLMFMLKARRPEMYRDSYTPPEQNNYDDAPESPLQVISSRIARIAERKREE